MVLNIKIKEEIEMETLRVIAVAVSGLATVLNLASSIIGAKADDKAMDKKIDQKLNERGLDNNNHYHKN